MASPTKELFDRVLALGKGQKIIIPFTDAKALQSKRVMLFREKRRYEDSVKDKLLRQEVYISQEINQKDGIYKLHLSTTAESADWLLNAVIVSDGAQEPLTISHTNPEEERIKKLKAEEEAADETTN